MAGNVLAGKTDRNDAGTRAPRRSPQKGLLLAIAVLAFLLAIGVSVAFADEGSSNATGGPSVHEVENAIDDPGVQKAEMPHANGQAAEELPHQDLSREQVNELFTEVFGPELQGPAGIFDELEVAKFYSDNVALIAPGDQPGGEGAPKAAQPTLLEASLPLRTENAEGQKEAVDLDLEHAEGELQPANPLVEVEVPANLGDGISLPEVGVKISLAGAPAERAPSTLGESLATYPNVAEDTSFAVGPAPTGVETLTLMQSADAPATQTFNLSLPSGASLLESEDGGAEVRDQAGEPLLKARPPSALDAAGRSVPVKLETNGDSVLLTAEPDQETSFPVLVDPMWETYYWYQKTTTSFQGWDSFSNSPAFTTSHNGWEGAGNWNPGLQISSGNGSISPGAQARWDYHVPRWATDVNSEGQHVRPTSYINRVIFEKLFFDVQAYANNPLTPDPFLAMYIWDDEKGFIAIGHHWGTEGNLSNMAFQYNLYNSPPPNEDVGAKQTSLELVSSQTQGQYRQLYVGLAGVELSDKDFPTLGATGDPQGWVNNSPIKPIQFTTVTDTGLGVREISVSQPIRKGGSKKVLTPYSPSCTGGAMAPCPRNWRSVDGPAIDYDPSSMPQGEDMVTVDAVDPVAHWASQKPGASAAQVKVNVDHSPPKLAPLGGTLTEQKSLGTGAAEYTLQYNASDGDHETATSTASIGVTGTGTGQLQRPMGVAVDGEGSIWIADRENNRLEKFDQAGKFLMQIGGYGTGNGQFKDPRGIAVSVNGTIWVSDVGNKRVQAFNAKGEFLKSFTYGSFIEPYGIAAGPGGVLWVSDPAAHRVFEFNESGTFIRKAYGSPSQPTGETEINAPVGLATDSEGNLWVADNGANRLTEFDAAGKYAFQFGSAGTGNGQFQNPVGIVVAPSGNLLVTDGTNNRVQEFQPNGTYLRQFGSLGAGGGQLNEPRGISLTSNGTALVADAGNHRIARWEHADFDPQSGVSSVDIKVDGQVVTTDSPGCATRDCSISREWTLRAADYSAGQHTVEVIAADGVGLSASRSLAVTTQKDGQAPQLSQSGFVFTAPDGWLEQESYPYTVTASDAGYGVTNLTVKIDGKTVKSSTAACKAGGCSMSISDTLNMASYSGGAHLIKLIATDGGGTQTKKSWIINVNPDGVISSPEAINTIDAADSTSESATVASTAELLDPEQIENGDNPGLEVSGSELVSTGVPDVTTMTTDPADGFTIKSPEGETTITPDTSTGASSVAVAEEVAAVAANTQTGVDSIVRPEYDGAQTFQAIREASSPEDFSWTVHLYAGQRLELVNDEQAQVMYEDGRRVFLISAEAAHDATGATVPTSLSVSGNVLTLTVHHRDQSFVYPVVAGQGWETSYQYPSLVDMGTPPPAPNPPSGSGEISLGTAQQIMSPMAKLTVQAPPPEPCSGACASRVRFFRVRSEACSSFGCDLWNVQMWHGQFIRTQDGVAWCCDNTICETHVSGLWEWNMMAEIDEVAYHPPYIAVKGTGKKLIVYCVYTTRIFPIPEFNVLESTATLVDRVYPNGYQESIVRSYEGVVEI